MTSFPSFASVNLFWFAVGSRLAACRAEAARRRVSRRWGVRYHSEGTAAQRRGYNTCHATGLRLLRNRGEADVLCSIKACSVSLLPPDCSSQAAHWRFWEFLDQAIRRDNNVDSIDTLQYAREIAGQRANWPASFGRRHVASASDLLRRRRWTWRSSLYRRRWSWRSSLRLGKYRVARHLRFVQITLPLAL